MKRTLQTTALLLAAMLAGFIGNLLGNTVRPADAAPDAPVIVETLRVRRIEVVDKDGKTRGVFSTFPADNTPFISLRDEKGTTRTAMSFTEAGQPEIWIADETSKPRGCLALTSIGASLAISDKAGRNRAVLGAVALTAPAADKGSEARIIPIPESAITFFDKDGGVITILPQ